MQRNEQISINFWRIRSLYSTIPQSGCSPDSSLYTREPWALPRQHIIYSFYAIAAAKASGFSFSQACISETGTGSVTTALPQVSFAAPGQLPRT